VFGRAIAMIPARSVRACLAVGTLLLLSGCSGSGYHWAWYVILPVTQDGKRNFLFLLAGYQYTIELTLIGFGLGVVLGLILAILGKAASAPLRGLVHGYLTLMRAIPTFVLLLWMYYALPVIVQALPTAAANLPGIRDLGDLSAMSAAAITLALGSGAFLSETFRAGIESVPNGHVEAALALGMTRGQTTRRIVLPLALRRMLPPTANQFVQTAKDSALASTIGFRELTRRVVELQNITFRPLELYTFLAVEYFVLIIALSCLVRLMERRIVVD
jgi:His/Glu/Gln/Arg/opine family amino acid ABC transporter permease subunit